MVLILLKNHVPLLVSPFYHFGPVRTQQGLPQCFEFLGHGIDVGVGVFMDEDGDKPILGVAWHPIPAGKPATVLD